MTRHLILGMGVAGISAAESIRTTDASAEIILVSDDPFGYYSTFAIEQSVARQLT